MALIFHVLILQICWLAYLQRCSCKLFSNPLLSELLHFKIRYQGDMILVQGSPVVVLQKTSIIHHVCQEFADLCSPLSFQRGEALAENLPIDHGRPRS